MNQILLVGVGGFIGAVMRFLAGGWLQKYSASFPYGTLAVNFTGTLALGFIMYSSEYKGLFDADTRIFLTIGILGAYTTMSTFGYESFKLLEQNQLGLFALNTIGTVMLMLFAIYLGRMIAVSL